jgi:GTP cyclohydrolase I
MLEELTTAEEFEFTTFDNDLRKDEMIVIKDIPFVSLCAHHLIPFAGYAHIGYIPIKVIAGLSKFPRAVKFWSKGLWTQEDLTDAIAHYLDDMLLEPLGVAVVMEAEHMCMTIRGVQTPGVKTITSTMLGAFLDPAKLARTEFFRHIDKG